MSTPDLSDNGLANAPKEIWKASCDSRVPNLVITPGNPSLKSCR